MTIPYALRLVCVCAAAFAIVFASVGVAVGLIAPAVLRACERMSAAAAARFVLGLRLLPAAFAGLMVAAICVPSYIRFEQRAESEEVGLLCLALAVVTAGLFGSSVMRTARAWRKTKGASAVLALVGIVRPRIVISEAARNVLSPGQLEMAMSHERAHAHARDNLKRLLILLAPGAFPRCVALEQAWNRFAEWAADDRAVSGKAQESLWLAAALVQVAKLGIVSPAPLTTAFLATAHDLEARVERLLNPVIGRKGSAGGGLVWGAAMLAAGLMVTTAAMHPAEIHGVLEHLIH